uniref:Putative secreted protein n=1 Tax=Anopheles triannulatus TaxID=58253 RepID=A0A2M4B5U9_9DIPT
MVRGRRIVVLLRIGMAGQRLFATLQHFLLRTVRRGNGRHISCSADRSRIDVFFCCESCLQITCTITAFAEGSRLFVLALAHYIHCPTEFDHLRCKVFRCER